MDIRNFFGGGGGGSTKKKSNGSASSKKTKKPAVPTKDTTMTKNNLSAEKKSPPKKTTIEPKEPEVDAKKKPSNQIKRRSIKVESDSDTDSEPNLKTKHTDNDTTMKVSKDKSDTPVKSEPIEDSKNLSIATKRKCEAENGEEGIKDEPGFQAEPTTPKAEPIPSPPKRRKTATPKQKKEAKRDFPKPTESIASYPDPSPGIFDGMTFVFTGVIDDLNREDGMDYVKSYGGRVTTAVSGKTNYLMTGSILEDGRDIEEGSKFKKAASLGDKVHVLKGAGELYGLAKLLDSRKKKEQGNDGNTVSTTNGNGVSSAIKTNPCTKSTPINPYAKPTGGGAIKNPYAKPVAGGTAVSNPYTKKPAVANPYAKSTGSVSNPYAKKEPASPNIEAASEENMSGSTDVNALWADKYAPRHTRMILGNRDIVSKLNIWLAKWEDTFNRTSTGKKQAFNPKTGPFKAALLSGPPGIGKTTTATLVAAESGRQILELNASDARSKKMIESSLAGVTGSQVLSFDAPKRKGQEKKRVIIMDEVDGMGAGDRGGMAELIKVIKLSKVPIICICNDRQNAKVKSLVNYCLDLKFRRPVKSVIARRAVEVGKAEGMMIEPNAAEAVAESCGNDIRQVLNCLQMWGNKKHDNKKVDMTYKAFKTRDNLINKDEMLRVSMFDATRMICEGRKGLTDADEKTQLQSLFKRTDAFFTDYSIMGLLVQQNYLKIGIRPFQQIKARGDTQAEYESLVNLCKGTEAMSDFAVAEHGVRNGDQNWGLLPFCAVMSVKSAYHIGGEAGGFLAGFPEFSSWLGKNSSRGKRDRLLQELGHHMNYKISADKTELRLGYLPVIRDRFVDLLMTKDGDGPKVKEAIEFMDEYGLDRDDIFENIDEFTLDHDTKKFADLESKAKAKFTREYNKGIHKSQALNEEQGLPTRKRKKAAIEDDEGGEEANNEQSDDDGDDEMTEEEIQKIFKRSTKGKNKRSAAKTKKNKKK